MGLVSGKSWRERGGAVRIPPVSNKRPAAVPQWLPMIGSLMVRYLTSDTYLLCSSVGGGLGPPCPNII